MLIGRPKREVQSANASLFIGGRRGYWFSEGVIETPESTSYNRTV